MKTKNLFRVLAVVMLFAFSIFTSHAQMRLTNSVNYTLPTMVDSTNANVDQRYDVVTEGSIMPYYINPDPSISNLIFSGVYNASGFFWKVSAGAFNSWANPATDYTIRKDSSSAVLSDDPNNANPDYYLDSVVNIQWLKAGLTYRIWTQEVPNSAVAGITACPGVYSSLGVSVVDTPSVAWYDIVGPDTIAGGCGVAGTTIPIRVDVTGTDLWQVHIQKVFRSLTGSPTVVYADSVSSPVAGAIFPTLNNTRTNQQLLNVTIPAATYGIYEYTITQVTDRISRKSLGRTANPGIIPVRKYKVYSLPTPSKKAIRHVSNLGW